MTMKRDRAEINEASIDVAKCLMLLSKVGETDQEMKSSMNGRMFTCKTCNKQFHSFQALGGHRASHKKPKLMGGDLFKLQTSPPKPKTHECPICGLEFAIGQALGGHMRRHKGAMNNGSNTTTTTTNTSVSSSSDDEQVILPLLPVRVAVPVLKKSNSSKRVVCNLELSLALPENYEDLKLQLGKICAPVV